MTPLGPLERAPNVRAQPGWRHRPVLQGGHALDLLPGGDALFDAMVQAMDAAQISVHLETYIFEWVGSPLAVAHALVRAAQRGVAVRLVVDGIGTGSPPLDWQARFAAAGVQWRVYAPLGRLGLLVPSRWRRLHRKLCVVDGTVGFCGGINLQDDHLDPHAGRLEFARFDFAVRCRGPLVADMVDTMMQLWWRQQALRDARQRDFRAAWRALQAAGDPLVQPLRLSASGGGWAPFGRRPPPSAVSTLATVPPAVRDAPAMLVLRDNVWQRTAIERAYLKAVAEARHDIVLANAYFVPGGRLRRALARAVRRGVTVRVLLQGQYEGFMQFHAARPVFKQLLDAGVDLREYAPSALHAKVAVVDGRWATVGSSNLDPLSLLLAREANVVTTDPRFAQDLRDRLLHAFHHAARPLDHDALRRRPWSQRLLDHVAHALMRLLLLLTGHRY